ncbi:MAG: DegT/DnrJ/EryC1/StrS family aminotransferase [Nitrospiraceae bacterium]|nr:MAG: DegT/DnrJ/EryC1/StrS family aminotransferase [Nitrospiraceae bacterium]
MIPMIDLKKEFGNIRDDVLAVVSEILESSQYILGKKVSELETRIASYHGVSNAVGVASGTDALHLALASLGIGHGDEVITTPFTFFATVEAIVYRGARPVFIDIEHDTMNVDPGEIEARITKKTKAILPVHLFGLPADMTRIMTVAKEHNLKVIEDCAQAFGAALNGKKVGSFGDAGCFSFYPSKNLGAYGDGGMITVPDPSIADIIKKLRNHGSAGAYKHEKIGFNSRLDELQAGILLIKLKRIDENNGKRRLKASLYRKLLSGDIITPFEKPGMDCVYHQFTIRSGKRDRIRDCLKDRDISSVIYYSVPLHMQVAVEFLGYKRGDFPVAEEAAEQVLSLPMYPDLEEATIENIADIINNV